MKKNEINELKVYVIERLNQLIINNSFNKNKNFREDNDELLREIFEMIKSL